jgi:chlorobactene glucosyltransferase
LIRLFEFIILYIIFGFTIFNILVLFTNNFIIRNITKEISQTGPFDYPKVSILVPARNEEKNIKNCINSLLNQTYENYEVLVLDDNSTDGTSKILNKIQNKKLIIIQGKQLPENWLGKNWACKQLYDQANGSYLLFTDADTIHKKDMLSISIKYMIANNVDLLTGFIREEIKTFGEKITIPFILWSINAVMPLFARIFIKSVILSATNGRFMFFKKSAYDKTGGHESVKDNVIEDLALGKKLIKKGLKWEFLNLKDITSCRMYNGFKEAYEGFSKNLFGVFNYHTIISVLIWLFIAMTYLLPLIVLIMAIFGVSISLTVIIISLISIFFTFITWFFSMIKYGLPVYISLLYPLSTLIMIFIGYRSIIVTFRGSILWKDRSLSLVKKNIKAI